MALHHFDHETVLRLFVKYNLVCSGAIYKLSGLDHDAQDLLQAIIIHIEMITKTVPWSD